MADPTIPSFTTRLWSEEVGIAAGGSPDEDLTIYQFSSGRKFTQQYPYDPPVPAVPVPPKAP